MEAAAAPTANALSVLFIFFVLQTKTKKKKDICIQFWSIDYHLKQAWCVCSKDILISMQGYHQRTHRDPIESNSLNSDFNLVAVALML